MNKPKVKLIGEDGNIFKLVGIASRALDKAGLKDKSEEMTEKIFASKSYNDALNIIREYCEIQ